MVVDKTEKIIKALNKRSLGVGTITKRTSQDTIIGTEIIIIIIKMFRIRSGIEIAIREKGKKTWTGEEQVIVTCITTTIKAHRIVIESEMIGTETATIATGIETETETIASLVKVGMAIMVLIIKIEATKEMKITIEMIKSKITDLEDDLFTTS
jgi:hypothetical protein